MLVPLALAVALAALTSERAAQTTTKPGMQA